MQSSQKHVQKDQLYLPSTGKEGSMEGERPGQPLTKEAGELEAADLLLADTGAPWVIAHSTHSPTAHFI